MAEIVFVGSGLDRSVRFSPCFEEKYILFSLIKQIARKKKCCGMFPANRTNTIQFFNIGIVQFLSFQPIQQKRRKEGLFAPPLLRKILMGY